jgi:hypothetical protein
LAQSLFNERKIVSEPITDTDDNKLAEARRQADEQMHAEVLKELQAMPISVPPVEAFRGMFEMWGGGGGRVCGIHGVQLEHSSKIGTYCPLCEGIEG